MFADAGPLASPPILRRCAGAPISWGVCEVPGWGYQLAAERVLAEMGALGLAATEFGPDGFLPADPYQRTALLTAHGLAGVGGFVPLVLHDPQADPLPRVAGPGGVLDQFVAARAQILVLSADTGQTGYDGRPDLDEAAWKTLLDNLDRLHDAAGGRGITATLHPHVGTVVEGPDEVDRVLTGSVIPLCLDTGHLLVGGTDPVALARHEPGRVAHVHLKDVDADLADRVRDGTLPYSRAVAAGMYRALGAGDADIAGIVTSLDAAGYAGWYVMEQDVVLDGEPARDAGPVADVRASLAFLRTLDPEVAP
jgi:inosose dehydratase